MIVTQPRFEKNPLFVKLTTFCLARTIENYAKWMLDFEKTIKIKIMVTLDSFRNFAYVRSYSHLKIFAWKRYCPIDRWCHEVDQGHSKKLLLNSSRVSLPHFLYDFWGKIFLCSYSINWPIFNDWLSLLLEILGNMCIAIVLLTRLSRHKFWN